MNRNVEVSSLEERPLTKMHREASFELRRGSSDAAEGGIGAFGRGLTASSQTPSRSRRQVPVRWPFQPPQTKTSTPRAALSCSRRAEGMLGPGLVVRDTGSRMEQLASIAPSFKPSFLRFLARLGWMLRSVSGSAPSCSLPSSPSSLPNNRGPYCFNTFILPSTEEDGAVRSKGAGVLDSGRVQRDRDRGSVLRPELHSGRLPLPTPHYHLHSTGPT